jgi:uncharacterized protein (TIGR04255 family)
LANDEEVFPNAPLIESVFEIKFPGNPALECKRDALYAEFEERFPLVKVPHNESGMLPAMPMYQFASADGNKAILSSIRSVGFSSKSYLGFAKFKKEALEILHFAIAKFKIRKLVRTGLRYTNVIPFTRENHSIPAARFLNMKVVLPEVAPQTFENIALMMTSKVSNDGKLTTRVESGIVGASESLVVDFDFFKEGNLSPNALSEYIENSHKHTKQFFAALITDDYRKVMRGEVLE